MVTGHYFPHRAVVATIPFQQRVQSGKFRIFYIPFSCSQGSWRKGTKNKEYIFTRTCRKASLFLPLIVPTVKNLAKKLAQSKDCRAFVTPGRKFGVFFIHFTVFCGPMNKIFIVVPQFFRQRTIIYIHRSVWKYGYITFSAHLNSQLTRTMGATSSFISHCFFTKGASSGRCGYRRLFETVDLFNNQEYSKGNNKKLYDRINKKAVSNNRYPLCLSFRQGLSRRMCQGNEKIRKIDTAQ